ncbi:MAG: Crp/Fnr family transcriptional regulator [Pseudomonadota bacterium]
MTEAEQVRRWLTRSSLFGDLETGDLDPLVSLCRRRELARGQMLFNQGDEADGLYIVTEGILRIVLVAGDGRELTLNLMEPGDVVGEISLLDGLPRSAGAIALTEVSCLALSRTDFEAAMDENPGLSRQIIYALCELLRRNTSIIGDRAFLDLRGRLCRLLSALAIGHGRPGDDGATEIAVPITQSDLATMLGATREAVNKQMNALAKVGLVRLAHGRALILDRDGLAEITEEQAAG